MKDGRVYELKFIGQKGDGFRQGAAGNLPGSASKAIALFETLREKAR